MSLTYFLCPDGIKRSIKECLENCPRKEGRCLSLPTLYEVGRVREWKGLPSTTMLLNPTRISYLQIIKDYAIDPFEQAFSLLGIRHHKRLEIIAKKLEGLISEQQFTDENNSGMLDLLEPDELFLNCWKMTDYKTWGAYSVAKIIGIAENGEYERRQVQLQLNDYRIKAESLGLSISRLFVQACVRDGGTMVARQQKIDFRMRLIPIDKLPNEEVIEYFHKKQQTLLTALENKQLPSLCPFEERWAGRRCKPNFCPVIYGCPEGAMVAKVKLEEE